MSKAFTRESDDSQEPTLPRRASGLQPAGGKNYITQEGYERLREEFDQLANNDRPLLASTRDRDPEAAARLARIDQRLRELGEVLASALVVAPPDSGGKRVRFGSWVRVEDPLEGSVQYRIVGLCEVDVDQGLISWLSPLAKALMNSQEGDMIPVRFPSGERTLRILEVR